MWCHICEKELSNYEDLKVHIMKEHNDPSEFYDGSPDSASSDEKFIILADSNDEEDSDENSNFVIGQNVNNNVTGNQGVPQPLCVLNPITPKYELDSDKCFDFCSDNILKWLYKYRELCKTLKYPLPRPLFDQIKTVQKSIFDNYSPASCGEETEAVMEVYDDLTNMIHRHISATNENL